MNKPTFHSSKNQAEPIKRKMKIEDGKSHKDFQEIDEYLKTVTKKFGKEPLKIEKLDKEFNEIVSQREGSKEDQTKIESLKGKSKRQEEKAIFYDIFIKPKENKIKELRQKQIENKESKVAQKENEVGTNNNAKGNTTISTDGHTRTFISNKFFEHGKLRGLTSNIIKSELNNNLIMSSSTNLSEKKSSLPQDIPPKVAPIAKSHLDDIIKLNLSNFLKNDSIAQYEQLRHFLSDKFVPKKDGNAFSRKNFFNQLIQIRPPEGINAVVASPLMESKGWAPSIPSVNIDKLNTNLSDLMIRAKGGIQAGDITKEAHMAFYLGIMNEEEKNYETALKFYKKYFLSAKLLQDIYGTELALNRIAVLYSNIFDYEQSIYYNEKHKDIASHNINGFVANYNCGVCYRILTKIDEAIKSFEKALKMADEENDFESYTLCLAQLAIAHIFLGNINGYTEHAEEFFQKNQALNHVEMQLEMLMLSGFIYSFCNSFDTAKDIYENALKKATLCGNEHYKALALCNIGIIEGNKDFDARLNDLNH